MDEGATLYALNHLFAYRKKRLRDPIWSLLRDIKFSIGPAQPGLTGLSLKVYRGCKGKAA